jgi:hypothetical protein
MNLKKSPILNYVPNSAISDEGLKCRTQFCRGPHKDHFDRLVSIGQVVSDEKIFEIISHSVEC